MPATAADAHIVLVSAVALVDPDGRVLLAQRPAGKPMAGLWEFPGGKVNPGETPETALIRELAEELGIDVAASCLAPLTFASFTYPEFHLLMPLYVCRKWSGIPMAREGQRLAWVRPARLGDYPMPPADKPLVAMLRDLRGMGETNALAARRRTPLRRQTLARAAALYAERFSRPDGRIPATFEILCLTGWAPDARRGR